MNVKMSVVLGGLLAGLLLSGCTELQDLRQIKSIQEVRIEELEKQNEEYKDAYFALKAEREKEQIRYDSEHGNLKREIEALKEKRSRREENLKEDNLSLNRNLQATTAKLNAALSDLKNLNKEKEDLFTRLNQFESSLKEKQSEAKKAEEDKGVISQELASLKKKIASLEQENNRKDDTFADLKNDVSSRNKKISELESEVSGLQGKLKETSAGSREYRKLKEEFEQYKKEQEKKASGAKRDTVLDKAESEFNKKLASEVQNKKVHLLRDHRGLVVRLFSDDLFESGSVIVNDSIKPLLLKISGLLSRYPGHGVNVEGHTDNVPIENLPFLDNLALSSARADNILRVLTDEGGIDKTRVKSIACSWFHPAATNKTTEGRKTNRRVEIILNPE